LIRSGRTLAVEPCLECRQHLLPNRSILSWIPSTKSAQTTVCADLVPRRGNCLKYWCLL